MPDSTEPPEETTNGPVETDQRVDPLAPEDARTVGADLNVGPPTSEDAATVGTDLGVGPPATNEGDAWKAVELLIRQSTEPGQRHPTGTPDLTGGWSALDDQPVVEAAPAKSLPLLAGELPSQQDPLNEEPPLGPEDTPQIARSSIQALDTDLRQIKVAELPPGTEPSLSLRKVRSSSFDFAQDKPVTRYPLPVTRHSLKADKLPLPTRVPESDPAGTRVASAAWRPRPSPVETVHAASQQARRPSRGRGCLVRSLILGAFAAAALLLIGGAYLIYQYFTVAATLPSIDDLRTRASQFETTRIYDRNGALLYEILDPQAGRRTYVPLENISPYLVAATIATEDKQFYSHPGFDPVAIVRAIWQNYRSGETVSGASTITQQLTRALLFDAEERAERTNRRKIREVILAAEITRQYTKEEILELYLNEIYYGNLAYGIEAAAQTYFSTTASKLDLAQASLLAGLPQAPAVYDVYTNRDVTLERQEDVLTLMVLASLEQNCIFVSNTPRPVCISPEEAGAASAVTRNFTFEPPRSEIRFPHWVTFVRSLLETQYDPQVIYRSGFNVFTTLDPELQTTAEQIVAQQINSLADKHVTDAALVGIRPATGEILAMVGSKDFYDEGIGGQINMAIRPRQPGSSIKPLTYVAAFEKGWSPANLIWDVPSEFPPSGNPDDPRPPYKPVNYDGRFHGPVTVRTALGNSYNVPAVKALNFVGIYDNPDTEQKEGLIAIAKRLGIATLERPDYGLSLTLGGGEVTPLELTAAYAVFANGGLRLPPVAILRITDFQGQTVSEYQPPAPEQVIRPEHAYLISDILADNSARQQSFGPNSAINLPFPAAAKTGTTNDFRDNWTLGYTPDLAVGVWVGNADNTPMIGTTGLTGAAPIWSQFMQAAIARIGPAGTASPFVRPATIVERTICAVSGAEPSERCPARRTELFVADQPPLPADQDLWQNVWVDTFTGLRASASCPNFAEQKFALNITDLSAINWILNDSEGRAWAGANGFEPPIYFTPQQECTAETPLPIVEISSPAEGQTVTGLVPIFGKAAATKEFDYYVIDFGLSHDPLGWGGVTTPTNRAVERTDKLADWDTASLPDGPATLRLVVFRQGGGQAEFRVRLNILHPTGTPTATATATETPTPTPTPSATATPTLTPSASLTASPTASVIPPTDTPTPVPVTDTPTPSPVPSDTPTPTPPSTP